MFNFAPYKKGNNHEIDQRLTFEFAIYFTATFTKILVVKFQFSCMKKGK